MSSKEETLARLQDRLDMIHEKMAVVQRIMNGFPPEAYYQQLSDLEDKIFEQIEKAKMTEYEPI